MKNNNQKLGTQATMVLAGFIALMVLPVQIASALIFTLMSGTSQAEYVDTGFNSWTANGVNQLTKAATYVKIEGLDECADGNTDGYFLIENSSCFQDGLFTLLDSVFTNETASFTYGYQDQFAITFNYELEGPVAPEAFPTSIYQSVEIENFGHDETEMGIDRQFEVVNYYNLTLDGDFGDTAYIDPNTGVGRQIDNEILPETLIATIGSDELSSAYEVNDAANLVDDAGNFIGSLNNNAGSVTGNPAVAYRFSEALYSGQVVSFDQTVEISTTDVFTSAMYRLADSLYNTDYTVVSADDDLGIAELPEPKTLIGLGSIAAIAVGSRLSRSIKKRLRNRKA